MWNWVKMLGKNVELGKKCGTGQRMWNWAKNVELGKHVELGKKC